METTENSKKIKSRIENLYKVFGKNPEKAIELYKSGWDKNKIHKKTHNTIGLANVSFDIHEGETLVVMGLSGSGKSTLIRCVNRLIDPSAGHIYVDGTDISVLDRDEIRELRRRKFGMVFQRFALFPHRTVVENAAYGLEMQGVNEEERKKKALKALDLVGLKGWGKAYPRQLSGGMQQRVGLARALAIEPDILLMDEAFSALDPLIRTDMQNELINLESSVRKTILFITHDLDEALKIGDRIVLMKDGEVVQIGTPDEILTNPSTEYVKRFLENVDITKVLTAEDVMKDPQPLAFSKDSPKTALQRMNDHSLPGLFVVKNNWEFIGYLNAEDAQIAASAGKKDLSGVVDSDSSRLVTPDTPVREIFPMVVDNDKPIAVVSSKKRLKGIIVKGSVIAALSPQGEAVDEAAPATADAGIKEGVPVKDEKKMNAEAAVEV